MRRPGAIGVRRGRKSVSISEAITKRHSVLIFLAVGLSGLAALPARAQTSGVVLAQGPGKLVDSMIAAGYGNDNLYEALLQMTADSNPPVADVMTFAFLSTLRACPANSTIYTTLLNSYAGSGVVVYANCTASATGLQGSGFNGLAGSTTRSFVLSGVSARAAVVSLSPAYALDATHSVFAVFYASQGTSQSFVLSNEAPGQLIGKLIAAGWGNLNLYEALLQIAIDTNPSVFRVLTPAFLQTLQSCAAGSPLWTIRLQNVTGTVAISDDCSVQTSNLQGRSFSGQPGTTTLATNISGAGPASLVSSTSSSPLTSWTQNVTVGSGTATVTYNAFAILYTPGSAPATPPPAGVPALSVWGMALLAGLLVGMAALQLHRSTRSSASQW
jgi:hypothetical protein